MVQRIHHQRSGAPDAIAVPRQSGLGFNASPSVVEESSTGTVPSPRGPRREDSFQPCGYEYPRGSRFDGVGRDPTLLACLPGIVNVHLPSTPYGLRSTEHGYLDFAGVSCRPRCCALTYAVAQAARSSRRQASACPEASSAPLRNCHTLGWSVGGASTPVLVWLSGGYRLGSAGA